LQRKEKSQVDNCENVPMRSIGDRRYRETPKTSPVHSNGQGLPYFALICDLSHFFKKKLPKIIKSCKQAKKRENKLLISICRASVYERTSKIRA
jgi:hypothetical protein